MNPPAKVRISPGHFATKADVLAEMARDDLWPVTVHQGAFSAAPLHCHAADVRIYVMAGVLHVNGGPELADVPAAAGTRIDIPAGAIHTVSAGAEVVTITGFASSSAAAGLPQLPVPEAQ